MNAPPASPSIGVRAVRAVAAAVALPLLFVAAFLIPGHDPQPNGLPVAVAGSPALARALAEQDFKVIPAADRAAAEARIRARDAYGAFVPGPDGRTVLVVASGASAVVAMTLTQIADDAGLRVAGDLAPLPDGDPRGVALGLLVLPVIITAIIGALLAVQLLPEIATLDRLTVASLVGALSGFGAIAIAHALDALPGSLLAQAGLTALMVTGVALTSGAIVRLVGQSALIVAFGLFLVIGNPAAGLTSAPELLPTPWKEIGGLLPPGALGDALRGTAYFDGAAVGGAVVVLLAWIAIGAGLNVLIDRRRVTPG